MSPPPSHGHPNPVALLPPFDDDGRLNVVVETTRGSRNRIRYDAERGLFALRQVLPAGAVFPHDVGFVPSTRAGDGDPLHALLLMDDAAFAGCLVAARLVGVIEAERADDDGGGTERDDRLVAVADGSHAYHAVRELADLDEEALDEIERFFASYDTVRGQRFTPTGRGGARRARALVEEGARRHERGGR
jgi:inorganic pyrophosphatase